MKENLIQTGGVNLEDLQQRLKQLAQQYQVMRPQLEQRLKLQQQSEQFAQLPWLEQLRQAPALLKLLQAQTLSSPQLQTLQTQIQEQHQPSAKLLQSLTRLQALEKQS